MTSEILQCTHIVSQLYAQNTDLEEKIWLSHDFEYLRYIFTKLRHQAPDYNAFDMMLELLETLIASTAGKDYQINSVAFFGSDYVVGNRANINTNNYVAQLQKVNSF